MHQRKRSKSENDDRPQLDFSAVEDGEEPQSGTLPDLAQSPNGQLRAPRPRVNSNPSMPRTSNGPYSPMYSRPPPSAGAFRTGFNVPPSSSYNASFRPGGYPSSPFRSSFQAPPSPSPLGENPMTNHTRSHRRANSSISVTPPPVVPPPSGPTSPASPASSSNRRHSRIHSRNLSIFFPRPGTTPHASIAEDGAQEIEVEAPRAGEKEEKGTGIAPGRLHRVDAREVAIEDDIGPTRVVGSLKVGGNIAARHLVAGARHRMSSETTNEETATAGELE